MPAPTPTPRPRETTMFDKLKAAAGVAGLLKDLPRMQQRLEQVKDELGRLQCTGHSSCRRVRARRRSGRPAKPLLRLRA